MSTESIAFFDFDGTITTRDTLIEIIKYQKGKSALIAGMIKLSPWLVAMKLKLLSNQAAKEKLLAHFFGGENLETFSVKCGQYINYQLPKILRPGAIKEIETHKKNNVPVVIVTASPELWVGIWCRQHNLQCIGTKLVVKEQNITGKIEGKNCYGREKVRRIKERFNLPGFSKIFCYGDTKGDKPMLSLATSAFYKPFRENV